MMRRRPKKIRKKVKSISEICRLARQSGMTYGEYVAKYKE